MAQAYLRVPIWIALGVAFLGERLTPTVWIGLGCVVIGGAQRLFLTAVGVALNPVPASRDRRCPLPAWGIVGILPTNPDAPSGRR